MDRSAGLAESSILRLIPIGVLPPGFAQSLAEQLSCRVLAPVSVEPTLTESGLPRLAGRDQIDAGSMLAVLEERAVPPGTVLVGVTALDIAIPIFTFVFGLARDGGRAVVVSIARLYPEFYGLPFDSILVLHRCVFEVLHELGHVAGLHHCREPECLMRFAGSVEQVDTRGGSFCRTCASRLPRWLSRQVELRGTGIP